MQKQNHLNFTEQLVVDYKIHPIIIKHESIQSTHCSIFKKKFLLYPFCGGLFPLLLF